jgi:hypothetical protein
MGEAEGDHTPERCEPPLDDDAHWLPIEAEHRQRFERTGNNNLAALDLNKDLAQGRRHCMARSAVTGERKLVARTEWVDQIEVRFHAGRARVFSRRPSVRVIARRPTRVFEPVRDRVFYVSVDVPAPLTIDLSTESTETAAKIASLSARAWFKEA